LLLISIVSLLRQNAKNKQHHTEKLPYLPWGSACAFLEVWYTVKVIYSVAILFPICANNMPRYTVHVTYRAGEREGEVQSLLRHGITSLCIAVLSHRTSPSTATFHDIGSAQVHDETPTKNQCGGQLIVTKLRKKFPAIY
jgi:hypothetical protein